MAVCEKQTKPSSVYITDYNEYDIIWSIVIFSFFLCLGYVVHYSFPLFSMRKYVNTWKQYINSSK